MSNPNFVPNYSSNEIYYNGDTEVCLTDVVDGKAEENHTHSEYASADHTHSGYAASDHTHTEYAPVSHEHTGYAASDHTHDGYATVNHEHTGYALSDHSHTGYAASNHTHSEYAPVSHEHTGYASADHTHTGFAAESHTHTPASIGAAPASHTHDYAPSNHTHTGYASANHEHSGYAVSDHTHTPESIGAASSEHSHTGYAAVGHTHSQYAASSHTHAQSDVTGLAGVLASKADLVDGKVPTDQLPSYVDDVLEYASLSSFPASGESGKIYVATDTNKTYRWSGTAYVEISASVAIGETASTAYRGDRGKTAYEHSQNSSVHVTSAQKAAWDSKAAGTHTHSYGDLTDTPTIPTIPASLPANGGNADTVDGKHANDFAASGHIHTTTAITEAKDLNELTTAGIYSFAVAYAPTNRPNGTTNGWLIVIPWNSNSDTQTIKQIWLRHGSVGENDHEMYVRTKVGDYGWSDWAQTWTTKDLEIMAPDGDVTESWTNQDVVAKAIALGSGMYTVYSRGGTTNNPKTTESWRFLIHKTGSANYGWVLAFGTNGSVYAGYVDNGSWKGWKCIYDSAPSALWSGAYYMNASQTVTPSKKLSECRNGWMLIWSDYDPDTSTVNDGDFVTSVIYKRKPGDTNWNGESHYFDVPRYIGTDTSDSTTEKRVIKRLYVYDNKLVGYDSNRQSDRNDVVLRAVYEF